MKFERLARFWLWLWWCGVLGLMTELGSRALSEAHVEGLWSVTVATWKQATLSTLISALLGVPLGLFLSRPGHVSARGRRWLRTLLQAPAMLPTLVVISMVLSVGGAQGAVTRLLRFVSAGYWGGPESSLLYSFSSVIAIHVILNAPWIASGVMLACERLSTERDEILRVLGASRWDRLRFWFLPALGTTLRSLILQVYLWCASSFAVVMLLGGGPPVETLETLIYSKLRMGGFDLSGATAVACVQLLSTLPIWWALRGRELARSAPLNRFQFPAQRESLDGRWSPAGRSLGLGIVGAGLGVGLALMGSAIRLGEHSPSLFLVSFWQSLKLALGASSVAMGLALLWVAVARIAPLRRLAWISAELSSGFSPLVLGLGFWILTMRWVDPFSGLLWLPALILGILATPLVFRQLEPHAEQSPRAHHEIMRTLGASAWQRFWTIEWPRWPALLFSVFGTTTALSLGEVSLVSLFAGEGVSPVALEISRGMARYRFEEAAVWSSCLGLSVLGILAGASWLRQSGRGIRR